MRQFILKFLRGNWGSLYFKKKESPSLRVLLYKESVFMHIPNENPRIPYFSMQFNLT